MLRNTHKFFLKTYILLFVLLSALFFAYIVLSNTIFFWAPSLYGMITDAHKPELMYNALLLTQGSWDTSLLRVPLGVWRDADRLELLSDTLSVQSGSIESMRDIYTQALSYERRKRIQDKIDILALSQRSWSVSSSSENTWPTKTWEIQDRYINDINNAKIRIKENQEKRGSYLRGTDNTKTFKDTIDFLDLGIERIDW
jgi:hypothetical protein